MSRRMVSIKSLILATFSAFSGGALAAGDMLQPNEIQDKGIEANPANDSGLFVGAGLTFGQARTTEEGASPGLATFLNVEPGFQMRRGSFGRLEFSGQFLFGKSSFRLGDGEGKVDVPVGFGLIAKAGYGYSLGSKMFGIMKAGLGPLMGKYEQEVDAVGKVESGTISGLAGYLGWTMVAPLTDSLDATGGISWTHMQFDVGDVEDSGGTEYPVDRTVIVNVPAVDLGLRVRF